MIRSFFFVIWLYGAMSLAGILGFPIALFRPEFTAKVIRQWARWVTFGLKYIMGITWSVEGLEHVPDRPVLVAAKHMSMMDTLIPSLFLKDVAFVFKKELLKMPIMGWYLTQAGMVPIDRDGHMSALKKMVAQSRTVLDAGRQLVIFPEGTRQPINEPGDYKPGVAAIYAMLGIDCLPMALDSARCWPGHGMERYGGHVTFKFCPIIPAGLKRAEFMERLSSTLDNETYALLARDNGGHVPKGAPKAPKEESQSDG